MTKEKSIVKYLLIPDDAFSVCYSSDYFSVALKSSLPFSSKNDTVLSSIS